MNEELTHAETINLDLAKCKPKRGYRPDWVIAAEHNQREKVVMRRKVNKIPTMLGII